MYAYYLKQFCGRFLFLIIIFLFISSSAIPCTAVVSTPTKFDSTEYIFIGRVIAFLGPNQPDSLHRDYNSFLVEIIDPIYLPKTPRKYFEIIYYDLSPDCQLMPTDLGEIQRLYPLNSYIRVVANDSKHMTRIVNPENLGLDLNPFNNSQISIDYPDIPQLHSYHDSKYDYRFMSDDSVANFLSSNKWITDKNKRDYQSSFRLLHEFELRKDLCRLSLSNNVEQKVEILKRLVYYPNFDQSTANKIVPLYIDDPKLKEQIINLYTPVGIPVPPDTTLHSELPPSLKSKWIHSSGPYGGDFNLLQLITNRSGIKYLFAGDRDTGLFRSSNNGKNWIKIAVGLTHNYVISLFSYNNYLFGGTSQGVFRSSDNGLRWDSLTTGFSFEEKTRINCFTSNSKFIFAGADSKGIFRSSDYGNSWVKINPAVKEQQVWALCAKDSLLFAGTTVGLYVSSDNGDNWLPANNGLPTNLRYPNGVTRLPVANIVYIYGKLFAGVEGVGLFLSSDNGLSWKTSDSKFSNLRMFRMIGDSGNLLLSSDGGVFLSRDSGSTWTPFDTKLISRCRISAVDHSNLYASSSNGIFFSSDFGKNWIASNNGLSKTYILSFAVKGNALFAETGSGLFKSNDNGKNWIFLSQTVLNYGSSYIASNEKYLFVGTSRGIYLTSDDGLTWSVKFEKENINALLVKGNLVLAQSNHGLCRSTDYGNNWTTDYEINWKIDKHFRTLSKFTECGGYVFAKGRDKLFRSTDDGLTWDTVKVPVKEFDLESMIYDGKNLYATIGSNGSIFLSTNKGAEWTISKKVKGFSIQSLFASDNYFFAASYYRGVFISLNHGNDWIPFNFGLGNLKVKTLIIKDNILFAGTSSGVWMHPLNK
jgi:photosystem II stability/assembly factor-like uncharacterized protein